MALAFFGDWFVGNRSACAHSGRPLKNFGTAVSNFELRESIGNLNETILNI
jgi:hypothetical protein